MEREGREEDHGRSILRPFGIILVQDPCELGLIKIRYFGRRINVDYPRSCLHLDRWKYEVHLYLFMIIIRRRYASFHVSEFTSASCSEYKIFPNS